jgi:hypothetical protein
MNEMLFNGQTGWICPKCDHVWAPLMMECALCNYPVKGVLDTGVMNRAMEQSLEHIRTHPPFAESSR